MSTITTPAGTRIYTDWGRAKLPKNATLKVYPGLPHGTCTTHPQRIDPDLLAFFHS